MLPQQYCLRWRYHHSNLQTMFSQLLEREAFCDVVLACEGKTIKAHKIVLSACSTYFDTILSQYEEKDPILIMKDVKYVDIKCLVEFMYKGEINVDHCHLATLLKTAEELRIKGLAEVSWRDEDCGNDPNSNGIQSSAFPHVSTVMGTSPKLGEPPGKRKRGRPPIDDYDSSNQLQQHNIHVPQLQPPPILHQSSYQQPFQPKIIGLIGGVADETYSNDALSSSDQDLSIWEEETPANDGDDGNEDSIPKVKMEMNDDDAVDNSTEHHMHNTTNDIRTEPSASHMKMFNSSKPSSSSGGTMSNNISSNSLEKDWPDVIKMNDYLNTGRRQQFWEEPFTKRVMDAIKTKNLEMKTAAELLGVSYGTLYGRYRDAYGCLKHPYRVRDFWTEQGPTDILLKLKRKEITLFRAAEQLNVTPQTLSNYLISMSVLDNEAHVGHSVPGGESQYEEGESEDDTDSILPDVPCNSLLFKNVMSSINATTVVANTSSPSSSTVLANCPDITIIKKEKMDGNTPVVVNTGKTNNDHSDKQLGNNSMDQK